MNASNQFIRWGLFTLTLLVLAPAVWAAEINGKWNAEFDTEVGIREFPLVVAVDGAKATVTVEETKLTGSHKDGKIEVAGTFYSVEGGYEGEMKLNLELKDDKLTGAGNWDVYDFTVSATKAE
ncbi:MAG: hypothetical protein GY953_50250 [bacterium]|nr:hypothetical protein [bacterium]